MLTTNPAEWGDARSSRRKDERLTFSGKVRRRAGSEELEGRSAKSRRRELEKVPSDLIREQKFRFYHRVWR